jgi:hypothetical protein
VSGNGSTQCGAQVLEEGVSLGRELGVLGLGFWYSEGLGGAHFT